MFHVKQWIFLLLRDDVVNRQLIDIDIVRVRDDQCMRVVTRFDVNVRTHRIVIEQCAHLFAAFCAFVFVFRVRAIRV